MKAIIIGALATAASADVAAQVLAARQNLPLDIIGDVSPKCSTAVSRVLEQMPTTAAELTGFSESYYKTAERTADATELDCAWVTEIPESLEDAFWDYEAEVGLWLVEPTNLESVMSLGMACLEDAAAFTDTAAPCRDEWAAFVQNVPPPAATHAFWDAQELIQGAVGDGLSDLIGSGSGGGGDGGEEETSSQTAFLTPTRSDGSSGPQRTETGGDDDDNNDEEGDGDNNNDDSAAATGFGIPRSAVVALLAAAIGGAAMI